MQAKTWPAHKKWTQGYLQEAFAGKPVIVGDYEMPFDSYLEYAKSSKDDMPLYLFDPNFAAKAPHLADDYEVHQLKFFPSIFADSKWSIEAIQAQMKRSGCSYRVLITPSLDPNAGARVLQGGPICCAWSGEKATLSLAHHGPSSVRLQLPQRHGSTLCCCTITTSNFASFFAEWDAAADPNGTSAWNAVVSGSKKWILVPPHIVPPGLVLCA